MANEFTAQQAPAPYVFQEFPKTLYNKEGLTKTVRSHEEQDAAGKEWGEKPVKPPAPAGEPKDKTADLLEAIEDLRRQTGEAILELTDRVSALEGGESEAKHKKK